MSQQQQQQKQNPPPFPLIITLALLSLLGIFSGPWTLHVNGLGDACLRYFLEFGKENGDGGSLLFGLPYGPISPDPSTGFWTGVEGLDGLLRVLVGYFSGLVDIGGGGEGEDGTMMGMGKAEARLSAIWGLVQFGAGWMILSLEGGRMANLKGVVGWVVIMGLTCQVASVMVTVPLWLILHLYTSPVATTLPSSMRLGGSTNAAMLLYVDPWHLAAVPLALVLSYLIPTVAMFLPSPSTVSPAFHYGAMAFWQPFPVYYVLSVRIIAILGRVLLGGGQENKQQYKNGQKKENELETYMRGARKVYSFAAFLGVMAQTPIIVSALAPTGSLEFLIPEPLRCVFPVQGVSLSSALVPPIPGTGPAVVDILNLAPGELAPLAVHFLLYDMYIGLGAAVLWALQLYWTAVVPRAAPKPNTSSLGSVMAKAVGWFVVGGPAAALACVLWERDVAVEAWGKEGKKKE